ncbi:MAG: tRNA lysidine(34) synthetase TilS, partial [Verrucomicrobiales bacterium]|nr:tRNA lysidine(34) synthetase TilS [Verrucomicrobiales bacterium]
RIRHELIPLLQRHYQPSLTRVLRRTATLLEDQATAIEDLARRWLAEPTSAAFNHLPTAVQRDVVRLQYVQGGLPVTFDLIESLRRHPGTPHQVGSRKVVTLTASGRLQFRTPRASPPFLATEAIVDLSVPTGRRVFGKLALSWRVQDSNHRRVFARPSRASRGQECLDAGVIGPLLHLRFWRPGDRFQPMGFPKPAKLQDLFTNQKVPAATRRRRVIAASATGQILWVQGLRLGEPAKITPITRQVLVLRWTSAL